MITLGYGAESILVMAPINCWIHTVPTGRKMVSDVVVTSEFYTRHWQLFKHGAEQGRSCPGLCQWSTAGGDGVYSLASRQLSV